MKRYPYPMVLAILILMMPSVIWPGQPGARAAARAGSATVERTMLAGPYALMLRVGPLERMYTLAQFRKLHPRVGEIMVTGTMAMGAMGAMPNRHLELHVYDGRSGKTIGKAAVAIAIRDATGTPVQTLPIAEMYGITAGLADLHFGNNLALKGGTYRVEARVNSVRATFTVTIGGASGSMSM